ncbi:hypothetical protein [Sphingobium boeckii]|uniref:Type IV secretory pathway VirB10-like protein n=1 Tax=Sphingobium boeckii TaxID=1082345 RepID=A0A7W9AJQ3_9SPHN|nr:hypothetical protein [Sphingobium boeckii]MBB5686833.1 type IV secretory pathway VirB10-like protein [Sphingobium boeckii]
MTRIFPVAMAALVLLSAAPPASAVQSNSTHSTSAREPLSRLVPVELPPSAPAPATPVTVPAAVAAPVVEAGTDAESAAINAGERQKAQTRLQQYQAQRDARAKAAADQRRTYDAAKAQYEADTARVNRENAEKKAKWEADTAACLAGDKTKCAPAAATPAPQ